jgi:hypothetical protein
MIFNSKIRQYFWQGIASELGANILGQFLTTLDYPNKRMILSMRGSLARDWNPLGQTFDLPGCPLIMPSMRDDSSKH